MAGEISRSMDPDVYRIGEGDDPVITLLGSRSDAVGQLYWPPRERCPLTGGSVSGVELPGTGTLWTWTYVYAPWHGEERPGDEHGYSAGLVDLDDGGPRVVAVLRGGPTAWKVGDRAVACALPFRTESGVTRFLLAFGRTDS